MKKKIHFILKVFDDIEEKYGPSATFFDQPWDMPPQQPNEQATTIETEMDTPTGTSSTSSSSPQLVMVYDFERGHGNIDISAVGDAATTSKLGIGCGFDILDDM